MTIVIWGTGKNKQFKVFTDANGTTGYNLTKAMNFAHSLEMKGIKVQIVTNPEID